MDELTVFVCTFNSGRALGRCLSSIANSFPGGRITVVDHQSTDTTREICSEFGVEVIYENVGLGRARQMCFDLCRSRFLAFVDSDVEVTGQSFFRRAALELEDSRIGAVVGMAVGHRFAYGLPASLLVLRISDFQGIKIPDYIDARETYFIQRRLDELHLKTVYVADAMIHRSEYREMKPEWEGANTRLASGIEISELALALKVIVLMSLNSRKAKNMIYVPIFFLKFMRGFANPQRFQRLGRLPTGR